MYRHDPLMRSLFSQSQTPTAPRSAVGFFRSGCPAGCPACLITQSSSGQQVLIRCPFRPSTETTLTENQKSSTQTIGAMGYAKPVHNPKCKALQNRSLSTGGRNCFRFCTKAAQHQGTWQNDDSEPNNRLDDGTRWAHLAKRKKFRGGERLGSEISHVSQKTRDMGHPSCLWSFDV